MTTPVPYLVNGQSVSEDWFNALASVVNGLLGATGTGYNVITPLTYGAVADGNSHPLSSVSAYQGKNSAGWSLAQWQVYFPFATSLANEIDQCAFTAAAQYAMTRGLVLQVPGGDWQINADIPLTILAVNTLAIVGDGPGVTRFAISGEAKALDLTVLGSTTPNSAISLSGITVYQKNNVLAGTGIRINGPTGVPGRPTIYVSNCQFGNLSGGIPMNSAGALICGIQLLNVQTSWFSNCGFAGTVNQTWGTAPVYRAGVGIQSNGNGNGSGGFYTFGPNLLNCTFNNLEIGSLIGDRTSSWVQGVKLTQCSVVACNYGVYWVGGPKTNGNDALMVSNCDIQGFLSGIYVDTVLDINITGNYFLVSPNTSGLKILNTNGSAQSFAISGNKFDGFGSANAEGLYIDGFSGADPQVSTAITGNEIFNFASSGSVPVYLGADSYHISINGNEFTDNNTPVDLGNDNLWANNTAKSTNSGTNLYAQGIPQFPVTNDMFIFEGGRPVFSPADEVRVQSDTAAIIGFRDSSGVLTGRVNSTLGNVTLDRYAGGLFAASLAMTATGITLGDGDAANVIKLGNETIIGSGFDMPTNTTTGFFHMPVVNGTPTGVPANATAVPAVMDRANSKLWVNFAGTWKSVTFT